MLKAAVHNGSQHLGLQEEISEPRGVDRDVVTLDLKKNFDGCRL